MIEPIDAERADSESRRRRFDMIGIGSAAFGGTPESLVGGLRIFENIHCTVRQQFRFPRSKRRRIRAKWAKRARNFRHLPDPNVYVMKQQGSMVGHPATIAKLRREANAANAANHQQEGG